MVDQDDDQDAATPVLRRAARIREEEVYTIADQLLVDGHRPSVERVRFKLGRGSPNTIALFLDRWWLKLGSRLRDLPGQELPGVPLEIANTVTTLWTQAIDHARTLLHDTLVQQSTQLASAREELSQRAVTLEAQQADLHRERESLHHTVALAQSQLQETNERHRIDTARLSELQSELTRTQQQVEQYRTERGTLAGKLESALQQHQIDVRSLNERLEATERHWLKEIDDARQALATERKNLAALERQRTTEKTKYTDELSEANTTLSRLKAELERARDQLIDSKAQATRLEATLAEQVTRADRTVQVMQESQTHATRQIEGLQQQLRETSEQLKTVTARLSARPDKNKLPQA